MSIPFEVSQALATHINGLNLTTVTCEAVLVDTFDPDDDNPERFTVQPISLQTYREARDILLEKSAYVISYYTIADTAKAQSSLNLLYDVQTNLAVGQYIAVNSSGVVIEETRFNSAIEIEKGSEFDGYYNSVQLEQNVFKSSFIVVVSRRLRIGQSVQVQGLEDTSNSSQQVDD